MGGHTTGFLIGTGALLALCGADAASAADIPVKAIVAAPSVYNWTGIYGGVHAGYGMGRKDWTNSVFDFDVRGFFGGGQIGVNQQIGNWVIGIEADASWANIKGTQTLIEGGQVSASILSRTGSSTIDGLVTVAARIGIAQDRWLVYFKGGAVWARENHTFNGVQTVDFLGTTFTATVAATGHETRFGPVIGFGTEYALWGNWSFKSEYNYFYLPNGTVRIAGPQTSFFGGTAPFTADTNIQQAFHLVKLGVNYRFGPEAPPAIAPAPPTPGYNWTGFYIGAEGGYGFGPTDWEGTIPSTRLSGGLAGGVMGTNAQVGVFVFGIESEWMWSGIKGTGRNFQNLGGGPTLVDSSNKIDWLSLSSLHAGFVAADRWLVYAKGGVALADETHGLAATQFIPGFGTDSFSVTGSALHTGYLAGVGIEYAFFGQWSAKIEYNYIHFRPQPFTVTGPEIVNLPPLVVGTNAVAERATVLQDLHLIKIGVNYHFNALPDIVSAKY